MKKESSLSKLTPDATLSQIVATDRKAGDLLASIGLNPDKYKNQTLRSVCQQRQWSEVEVLRWVKKQRSLQGKAAVVKPEKPDFGDDLAQWSGYIKDEFHKANLGLLDEIKSNFPRVHKIHGNQYPWLKNMEYHFEQFDEALRMYYEFEARKFFPLIKTLQTTKGDLLDGTIRKLQRSVEIVDSDQKRLRRLMRTLAANGNDFENPGGACSTMCILNQNFKNLFADLNKQFELEKEELLPFVKDKVEVVHQ